MLKMFSGIVSSIAMYRQAQREEIPPPIRFVRKARKPSKFEINENWQEYSPPKATLSTLSTLSTSSTLSTLSTHRNHPLLPRHGKDGVVAPRSPSSGVDEEMDWFVRHWGRRQLREHYVQVDRSEHLLQGVEGEATELALDEVGAVLHDGLQLDVSVPALPPRDEVQHVGALRGLAVLPAGVAGEGDAQRGEEREIGGLVPHAQEPGEEVDLRCDSGDGQEAGGPHDEEGEYCLVGEVGVDVGCLKRCVSGLNQ